MEEELIAAIEESLATLKRVLDRVKLKKELGQGQVQSTNPKGAKLRFVNLSNLDLTGINFDYADLTGSDLRDSNLSNASFQYAILRDVHLGGTQCKNTNFHYANLTGVCYSETTNFEGADFSCVTPTGTDLRYVRT
jgi:uncharacterized protein YjbI with pentapeptide repeats